jgi:UDP-N-acetylmuramoyl-L-alanyl-D-glutamate--2,6-diaminopimelate ligase
VTLGDLLDRAAAMIPLPARETIGAGLLARPVSGIEYDSRRVEPGGVFFALRGQHADGAAFAPQALSRGALLVISDRPAPHGWPGAWFTVPDARLALAASAAIIHGHPSEALLVVGVTGTNGKTTTTYLLASMLDAAGYRCGRIGTIAYRIGAIETEAVRTTPEAPDVQRLLRAMADERCTACAMEVSSHALALRRADGIHFSAGLFTNLTRDHLDFHGGMEEYFAAKRRLFELLPHGAPAVVNVDDPYGRRLAETFPRAVTFALERPAAVAAANLSLSLEGLALEVRSTRGTLPVVSPLVGRPNAYNVLATVATGLALDLPSAAILQGVRGVASVPGRFETVSSPDDDVTAIVDYAHTDDALRNLLDTARPLAAGRLVTVFGCGGDRDRSKRPLMGAVAARLSDLVVVTSDNPRSEDPDAIIDEIVRGLAPPDRPAVHQGQPVTPIRTTPWLRVTDREEAIHRAIREARRGDVVVIAGKGHEKSQVIGSRVLPFDDAQVARAALARRRQSRVAAAGRDA